MTKVVACFFCTCWQKFHFMMKAGTHKGSYTCRVYTLLRRKARLRLPRRLSYQRWPNFENTLSEPICPETKHMFHRLCNEMRRAEDMGLCGSRNEFSANLHSLLGRL